MNVQRTQDTDNSRTSQNISTTNTTLGKDDFLKLLMVQLQNQDPTDPVDNNAMLAQLAQFSALEQQQRTADLMEDLLVSIQRNEQLTATSYIGKTVRAKGFELNKNKDDISTVYYSTNQPIHEGKIYVYNADGEVVYTEDIGSKQSGFYEFQWDGKNNNGTEQPDGKYTIAIQAKTAEDKAILVHTEVSGVVVSAVTENGKSYLRLTDGRVVELDSVYEVYDPSLSPKPEEKPEEKPEDEEGKDDTTGDGSGTEGDTTTPTKAILQRVFAPKVSTLYPIAQ